MKKLLLITTIIILSLNSQAQVPDSITKQKESKILTALGGMSAGFIYNTYAAIGAVADGYGSGVYNDKQTTDVMETQKSLCSNLIKILNELIDKDLLENKDDQELTQAFIDIIKGLKDQAQYYEDYIVNKTDERKEKYDNQREENWKSISKVMGLDK